MLTIDSKGMYWYGINRNSKALKRLTNQILDVVKMDFQKILFWLG